MQSAICNFACTRGIWRLWPCLASFGGHPWTRTASDLSWIAVLAQRISTAAQSRWARWTSYVPHRNLCCCCWFGVAFSKLPSKPPCPAPQLPPRVLGSVAVALCTHTVAVGAVYSVLGLGAKVLGGRWARPASCCIGPWVPCRPRVLAHLRHIAPPTLLPRPLPRCLPCPALPPSRMRRLTLLAWAGSTT